MSYSLGLTESHLVHGIMSLSGRMLEEIKPLIRTKGAEELELLIIHGTQDRVLGIDYARQAKQYLEEREFQINYHEINAGHTINSQFIQLINQWLSRL